MKKICLLILVARKSIPAWQAEIIDRLAKDESIDLSLCTSVAETPCLPPAWGWSNEKGGKSLFWRVLRVLLGDRHDLDSLRAVQITDIATKYQVQITELSNLANEIHLILSLIDDPPDVTGIKAPLWIFENTNARIAKRAPVGFWEYALGQPVIESSLIEYSKDHDAQKVVAETATSVDELSIALGMETHLWKCSAIAIREVVRPRVRSADRPKEMPEKPGSLYRPGISDWVSMLRKKLVVRWKTNRRVKKSEDQWVLAYGHKVLGEGNTCIESKRKLTMVFPPLGKSWTDPYAIYRGDETFVFVEEFDHKSAKGRISVIKVDRHGEWMTPIPIIERDYHLSYPFMIEDSGRLFLVPESAENHTVELYECVDFPHKWKWVMNLQENIDIYDATFHRWNERWWMFGNVKELAGMSSWDELFLFSADTLETANWRPHPCNPIVSDVRYARPAGGLIKSEGRLYRPAQDSAYRYGNRLNLHEIVIIDEESYQERLIAKLQPSGHSAITGMHSLSLGGDLDIFDVRVRRSRSDFRPEKLAGISVEITPVCDNSPHSRRHIDHERTSKREV